MCGDSGAVMPAVAACFFTTSQNIARSPSAAIDGDGKIQLLYNDSTLFGDTANGGIEVLVGGRYLVVTEVSDYIGHLGVDGVPNVEAPVRNDVFITAGVRFALR